MMPGGTELLVILLVVVLLFGPTRLPALAHAGGRALGEFELGRTEVERDLRAASVPETTDVRTDAEPTVGV